MYLSISFALGLLAYLRQAALSLDRAPTSFCEAMRSYYDSHGLPPPARVAAHIDAPAQPRAFMVPNLLQRLFRNSVSLSETELREIRAALRGLETVLESQVVEASERMRIRLALSKAESLVERKLGRYGRRVQMIEHLNESLYLDLKPLGELVGANWPDSISWIAAKGTEQIARLGASMWVLNAGRGDGARTASDIRVLWNSSDSSASTSYVGKEASELLDKVGDWLATSSRLLFTIWSVIEQSERIVLLIVALLDQRELMPK